jgi:hypothetical protein
MEQPQQRMKTRSGIPTARMTGQRIAGCRRSECRVGHARCRACELKRYGDFGGSKSSQEQTIPSHLGRRIENSRAIRRRVASQTAVVEMFGDYGFRHFVRVAHRSVQRCELGVYHVLRPREAGMSNQRPREAGSFKERYLNLQEAGCVSRDHLRKEDT